MHLLRGVCDQMVECWNLLALPRSSIIFLRAPTNPPIHHSCIIIIMDLDRRQSECERERNIWLEKLKALEINYSKRLFTKDWPLFHRKEKFVFFFSSSANVWLLVCDSWLVVEPLFDWSSTTNFGLLYSICHSLIFECVFIS